MIKFNNESLVVLLSFDNNVQVMTLHDNSLETLDEGVLSSLENSTTLKLLTLRENPWVCQCDSLRFINSVKTILKMKVI